MIKLLVSTTNPLKVEAISDAFVRYFQDSFEVDYIKPNPSELKLCTSSYETLQAALERAKNAKKDRGDFNYYIGIETGIEYIDSDIFSYTWVVILHDNKSGKAKSTSYMLPSSIKIAFEKGEELGQIIEKVYGADSIDKSQGMIATLTKGEIYRKKLIEETTIIAISSLEF